MMENEIVEGQISIFDILEKQPEQEREIIDPVAELQIGDYVKVRGSLDATEYEEIEDYFYIRDFTGKKGQVIGIHVGRNKVSYCIDFGKEQGWFHGSELIYV